MPVPIVTRGQDTVLRPCHVNRRPPFASSSVGFLLSWHVCLPLSGPQFGPPTTGAGLAIFYKRRALESSHCSRGTTVGSRGITVGRVAATSRPWWSTPHFSGACSGDDKVLLERLKLCECN